MTSCQQLPSNGFFPNEALRHNIMLSSGVSFSSKPSLFSGNLSTESTKPPPTRNLRRSNQEYSFLSPKSKRQKQEPLQEWVRTTKSSHVPEISCLALLCSIPANRGGIQRSNEVHCKYKRGS